MTGPSAYPALRAWALLVVLSLAGTALSLLAPATIAPVIPGLVILGLGWAKARLILLDYLGLAQAPRWRGGAVTVITLAVLILAGLYLAGQGRA